MSHTQTTRVMYSDDEEVIVSQQVSTYHLGTYSFIHSK